MGRMPSFQFYTADWKADTELAKCSLATRGFWTEVIVAMRISAKPTMTETPETFGQVCRCTAKDARDALRELIRTETATGSENADGTFTITCRRMAKDLQEQARWRESKKNERNKGKPPPDVPPLSRDCPGDVPPNSRKCPANVPPLSRPSSASASDLPSEDLPPPPFRAPSAPPAAAATAEWAALKKAGIQDEGVLRELVAGGVTLAMVEKYAKKPPGLIAKCIRDDLRDAAQVRQNGDAIAAWLESRSPEERDELARRAIEKLPAESPFRDPAKVEQTRTWKNVVAQAMAGGGA